MLQVVREGLKARRGRLPEICAGLPGIEYSWLTKVMQGRIKDPSVNKIQVLYDYLKGIDRTAAPPAAHRGAALALEHTESADVS